MLKTKNNILKLFLVILGVSLVVTVIVFFLPSPSNAELNITWSPESITETVSPGESKTILVRITPDKKMDDVEFEISDTLEPFVHIEPSSFSRIRRNETVELSVTISADIGSALGSYDGFISLENEHRDNDGEHGDREIERAKISKERDEHDEDEGENEGDDGSKKLQITINVIPSITWFPESITETVSPGEIQNIQVSFKSSRNIQDLSIRIMPELEPFIQVEPTFFSEITEGQQYKIRLTAFVNYETVPGIYDGIIQLISNFSVHTNLLPVRMEVPSISARWESYSNAPIGIEIKYPPTQAVKTSSMSLSDDFTKGLGITSVDLISPPDTEGMGSVYIEVFRNPNNLHINDWLVANGGLDFSDDLIVSDITIDGILAKEYRSLKDHRVDIYIAIENRIYLIDWPNYGYGTNYDYAEDYSQIFFNEFLNNIKFIR